MTPRYISLCRRPLARALLPAMVDAASRYGVPRPPGELRDDAPDNRRFDFVYAALPFIIGIPDDVTAIEPSARPAACLEVDAIVEILARLGNSLSKK
jgi:hypothetical protein